MTDPLFSQQDVAKLQEMLFKAAPEFREALTAITADAKDEATAAKLLWEWCSEHPDVMERLVSQALAPLKPRESLQSALPALLAPERAQFDGDTPEYRNGVLMGNQMPAVPVRTDSRNPVQIGLELEQASEVVKAEHDALLARWQLELEQDPGFENAVTLYGREEAIQKYTDDHPVPQPEGYKTGQKAEMVPVFDHPSVLALSPEKQQALSYKALTSTQGRRSAVEQITDMVQTILLNRGQLVVQRAFSHHRKVKVLTTGSWSASISGQGEHQAGFAFVDTAAKAIAAGLNEGVDGFLEIVPIDTVDVRRVGWAGRIVEDVHEQDRPH